MNALPDKLIQMIEAGYVAMSQHPLHDLKLGYRQAIWAAMGPHLDLSQGIELYGWRRRTRLAIAAVKYVLPIWERTWPDDDVPHRTLTIAEDVLNENVDKQTARKAFSGCWMHADNLSYRTGCQYSIEVVYGAASALSTAIYDEQFDSAHIDLDLTDAEIDPYDRDASWAAVVAYANGRVQNPESDKNKRREFWEWWLKEAVPLAWRAVEGQGR